MTFLITGGSGKLGSELKKLLPDSILPSHRDFDVSNHVPAQYTYKIDTVIHCAAYTDVPGAEFNKTQAIATNIIGSKVIAENFMYHRIVYISSDYVYAGINGNYKETDKPAPFNFYGFTKFAGEAYMKPEKDLIIRTSFKPNIPWPYPKSFTDLYSSADYVDVIAKYVALLCKSDLTGIINVGTERKSIYDLAKQRNPNIEEMSKHDVSEVKLPLDISMNIEKFEDWRNKNGR